jgi:hypothetical protein
MPLPLENLDDLTYADLVEEARSRIPALDPEWTNHNPSDPGITLLELLAWRTEMLVYRTNQVPAEHLVAFLKLLKGPEWNAEEAARAGEGALEETARATVLALRKRFRAVTAQDYEALATSDFNEWRAAQAAAEETRAAAVAPCRRAADHLDDVARAQAAGWPAPPPAADACPFCVAGAACPTLEGEKALAEWWRLTGLASRAPNLPSRLPAVARARCVPERDLEARRVERRKRVMPGHVSLVVVPASDGLAPGAVRGGQPADPLAAERSAALTRALWTWLDERRTLTTHHHVVAPRYVPVRLRAVVVLQRDVPSRDLDFSSEDLAAVDKDAEAFRMAFWSHLADLDPRRPLQVVLERFFDPVRGGREKAGWPYGRSVYLSELYELLEHEAIVEYVSTIQVCSTDPGARLLWNRDGEVFGMELGPESGDAIGTQLLPRLELSLDDIIVCESTVPVEVVLTLPPLPPDLDDVLVTEAEGAMHAAVKGAFPPFGRVGGGSGEEYAVPTDVSSQATQTLDRALGEIFAPAAELAAAMRSARTVGAPDIAAVLRDLPDGFRPTAIVLRADAARLGRDGQGRPVVRFQPGEHAEVRVTLQRSNAEGAP